MTQTTEEREAARAAVVLAARAFAASVEPDSDDRTGRPLLRLDRDKAWALVEAVDRLDDLEVDDVQKVTEAILLIDASKRLPAGPMPVLVWHRDGVDRGICYGSTWRLADYSEDELHGVTHWAEVPEAPDAS
jgi:hypothetical protein